MQSGPVASLLKSPRLDFKTLSSYIQGNSLVAVLGGGEVRPGAAKFDEGLRSSTRASQPPRPSSGSGSACSLGLTARGIAGPRLDVVAQGRGTKNNTWVTLVTLRRRRLRFECVATRAPKLAGLFARCIFAGTNSSNACTTGSSELSAPGLSCPT